jgi:hypothetical protein
LRTKEAGPGVVIPNRPTQQNNPVRDHSTAHADRTATLQARGQLRRADALEQQADRLQAAGRYAEARPLRHEARRLRHLARGARPEAPLVDIERQLAAGQLARWAGRRVA